MKKTPKP